MEALVIVVALGLALAWLGVSARRAITICIAEVVDGSLTVTHGGLVPQVLGDLRDIVKRPPVRRATLRVIRAKGRARLEVQGAVSDAQLQQIRNVIGTVPLARLLAHGGRR